jgi:hypothetical protein
MIHGDYLVEPCHNQCARVAASATPKVKRPHTTLNNHGAERPSEHVMRRHIFGNDILLLLWM